MCHPDPDGLSGDDSIAPDRALGAARPLSAANRIAHGASATASAGRWRAIRPSTP